MTREEFCKSHWEYYMVLEKDFLEIERYVAFELGENNLYITPLDDSIDKGNSECFSNEFIKQYQAICSEADVIFKSICYEINPASTADKMGHYTSEILFAWPTITQQRVKAKDTELKPFQNWTMATSGHDMQSPDWWTPYNKVKHERLQNYRKANLKNTLNALAGLYILEQYLVKFIGNRDGTRDVPNDVSKLFTMIDYSTRDTVIGKEMYRIREDEIDAMFA